MLEQEEKKFAKKRRGGAGSIEDTDSDTESTKSSIYEASDDEDAK